MCLNRYCGLLQGWGGGTKEVKSGSTTSRTSNRDHKNQDPYKARVRKGPKDCKLQHIYLSASSNSCSLQASSTCAKIWLGNLQQRSVCKHGLVGLILPGLEAEANTLGDQNTHGSVFAAWHGHSGGRGFWEGREPPLHLQQCHYYSPVLLCQAISWVRQFA